MTRAGVEPRKVQQALLAWYDKEARDLPWRGTKDPFGILVSEIMLQQTRVPVVRERWTRFLKRFPDPSSLAAAQEAEVLAEWAGLGYYRRAKSLQAAARILVERHGGLLPREVAQLEALPGVGPYTAGAIASIAFGLRAPLVDGNLERVFARWERIAAPAGSPQLKARSWDLARALLPDSRTGDWNQALMELGATLCTPRSPRCADCPVSFRCRSSALGDAERFPTPKLRRATVEVEVEIALLERRGRLLFRQRGEGERMAGLYELPTRETAFSSKEAPLVHQPAWPKGLSAGVALDLPRLLATVTHHKITARARRAQGTPLPAQDTHWLTPEEALVRGVTALTRKVLLHPSFRGARLPREKSPR